MTRFLHVIICFLAGGALADAINLEARVGGDVQIRCSHGFAHENVKYFCNKKCSNRDVLIKSDRMRNPIRKGRYTLLDEGSGVFTVTISGLKKSDSGTYWCGVQRMFKNTYLQVMLTVLEAPETTSYTAYTASHPGNSPSDERVKSTEPRTESETSSTITGDFFTTTNTTNPETPETPENKQLIYIGSGLACLVLISAICLLILIKQTKKHKSENHKAGKAQIDCNNKHSKPEKDPQIPMKTNQQKTTESSSANQSTPPIKKPHPDPSSSIYSNITPHSEDALNYSTVNFARQSEDMHYSSVLFIRESDAHSSHLDSSPGETSGPSVSLYSTVIPTDCSHSANNANAVIYSTIGKES